MRCGTYNIEKVSRVLMDKSVYPFTVEDGPQRFPIWTVLNDKNTYVLMPYINTVAILFKHNDMFDFHFYALKPSRGAVALKSANMIIDYMFSGICEGLFSVVPVIYNHAIKFYKKIGMKKIGLSEIKFLKNGVMNDQIILSLSKEK